MKMIDSALWTYILKVLGMIDKDKDAKVVNGILEDLSSKTIWTDFRGLLMKSKRRILNEKEWKDFGKLIESCARMFLKDAAHATVCTVAQLTNEWAKDVKYDWVVVDEGTRISEAQMVQVWRTGSTLILIGDQTQLGPTTLSKPKENPFTRQLQVSPYERLVDNNHPFFLLLEVMRSTAGLEIICSDLFYSRHLKPYASAALQHDTRAMSRLWKEKMALLYPALKPEPAHLVYPVFLNITAQSEAEPAGGTSRVNKYNLSQVVSHMIWVVENKLASPEQIGIATAYAGQVAMYYSILRQLSKDRSGHEWMRVRVGTTEWWMGRQAEYIIVDLVRATNDVGQLGFLAEGRRINVLLSRQEQALVIVGDKDCVNTPHTGSEKEDQKVIGKHNHDSRHVIKMLEWLTKNGRLVEIPLDSLSQDYVKLDPISSNAVEPETGATSGNVGEGGWDVVAAAGNVGEGQWDVVAAAGDANTTDGNWSSGVNEW